MSEITRVTCSHSLPIPPSRSFLVVLEINDVVESDAGLYKVRAKNKFGEVAASINLNFSREYKMSSHYLLPRHKMNYI